MDAKKSVTALVVQTAEVQIKDEIRAEMVERLGGIAEHLAEYPATAAALTVTDQGSAARAEGLIEAAKADIATVEEVLGEPIQRLHNAHREWTRFRSEFTDPLNKAARTAKGKVIEWQQAEIRKAQAEQARLQAIEDERARKERARLEAEAAKLKTPEKKAERLEAAQAVTATVITVTAPKAGVTIRKVWRATLTDPQEFFKAVVKDANLRGYVAVDTTRMNRAKAANGMLEIPGVKFEQVAV